MENSIKIFNLSKYFFENSNKVLTCLKVYMVRRKTTKQEFAVKAFSKKALDNSKNGKMSLINEIKMKERKTG